MLYKSRHQAVGGIYSHIQFRMADEPAIVTGG